MDAEFDYFKSFQISYFFQANTDFFLLCESLKEYLGLITSVKVIINSFEILFHCIEEVTLKKQIYFP